MALEVARRLIDGIWGTSVEDSGDTGDGSMPAGTAKVLGPYTVTFDTAGIDVNPGSLLDDVPEDTLIISANCIVTIPFDSGSSRELVLIAQYGDLHDYWYIWTWDVGATATDDGLGGAASFAADQQEGAHFAAAGNLRAHLVGGAASQGEAKIYVTIATLS